MYTSSDKLGKLHTRKSGNEKWTLRDTESILFTAQNDNMD